MKALKLNWIKNNVEAVICFGLFVFLMWVGVYFIGIEKTRAMILSESAKVPRRIPTQEDVEREIGPIQQRSFLGLLTIKPFSYYSLIVRRNPFVPLPAFSPPPGNTVRATELEVTSTLLLPEGQWGARIRNKSTGGTYNVKVGDWLVTSHRDSFLPAGVRIGQVAEVSDDPKRRGLYVMLRIKPHANLSTLRDVYIVEPPQGAWGPE